jgi:hypothetical protein
MMNLPTIAELATAVYTTSREDLQQLLADRLADTIHCGLEDLTHVLVVEPGDSEEQIVEAIGFSPLVSRIDNVRSLLDCDWIEHHTGWWEMLYTVGNSGFAYILLVEDDPGNPLAELCRQERGR